MHKLRFRALILATAVIAVASLCHLSTLYDETQARVEAHGTWCERTGPHPSGLAMVSDTGGATWNKP